ncbi:MAG: Rrf2 family transcriptional regulator [Patescibacteria group bacterium]
MPGLFQIPARDHCALILMTELAECFRAGEPLTLQDVARRMHLSQGYLEEIAGALKAAGLIRGKTGPGGGYVLARPPKKISLHQILEAVEGPLELVACQAGRGNCLFAGKCSSQKAWGKLQNTILKTLKNTSLEQTI